MVKTVVFSIIVSLLLFYYLYTKIKSKKFGKIVSQNVLITGGSSGLGLEVARILANQDCNVLIVARNEDKLKNAVTDLGHKNRVFCKSLDITDSKSCKAFSENFDSEFPSFGGRIDILVLCAGKAVPGFFLSSTDDDFISSMNTNYFGSLFMLKSFLPKLMSIRNRTGGEKVSSSSVVFVGSTMSLFTFAGYSSYAPSKWALRALSDTLRNELKIHSLTEKTKTKDSYGDEETIKPIKDKPRDGVIARRVEVHLFLPSNMDTPGFVEEEKMKPQVTRSIEGKVASISAKQSAENLLNGMAAKQYLITQDWFTYLLSVNMAGANPRVNICLDFLLLPVSFVLQVTTRLYCDLVCLWQ